MAKKAPRAKKTAVRKKPTAKKSGGTRRPRAKPSPRKTPPLKLAARKPKASAKITAGPSAGAAVPRTLAPADPESVKKKKFTEEKARNNPFWRIMKLWRLLHDDGGRTLFTKEELAKRYFPQHEADPEPEEVPYADGEESEIGDLDYAEFPGGDADGLDDLAFDDASDDGDDESFGSFSSGDTLAFARLPRKKARKRKKKPHRYGWPSNKQKQDVTRHLLALQREGVDIWNVVRDGEKDLLLDDEEFESWQKDHPSEERRWRYNPDGYWAKQLDHLLDQHHIQGYELVGIIALQEMLEAMEGTPHHEATAELIDKIKSHVPPLVRAEATEKARAWRYSVANIRKYSTEVRKRALAAWHRAAIDRIQVEIDHQTPGKPQRKRRIAALGTMFDREENSIYFLGSEAEEVDGEPTGRWRLPVQWKFDRIMGVKPLEEQNPPFSDIFPHELFGAIPGGGPERLDIGRLYSDSAGAFLRYNEPTIRLEMLVHAPGWMAWCLEKPFHPNQDPSEEIGDDGQPQLRIVIERCHEREMASRLLRLGGHFTVVSPQSLIDRVRANAEAIARRHGQS